MRVFPRLERSGLGRAKSGEAGVLLRPVALGAAPAGQVSGQGLLQDADTRSAGWFQPAPAAARRHLLLLGRCWGRGAGAERDSGRPTLLAETPGCDLCPIHSWGWKLWCG